ncbi:hypothetical protein OA57_06290 [Chelonobacter oris]|uniref:DUF403 domain-containing protein n=1 Tax=Chelonobacter oris TaxID=505317 RepID=A0A0A3BA48_9PAST|nr:alpha-E domain-containing protein [Chelonobacter oris]KGQ70449.1 hypothetical protein OA57_06290 [Chelonobacter oris]
MNILLLSTANDLFWLGRYMQRAMKIQARLFIHKDIEVRQYLALLGITPPTDYPDQPEAFVLELLLPHYFEMINNNVQTIRGVIDKDAYQLFTDVTRLRQNGSLRAACFELYACRQAMNAQDGWVKIFWKLGEAVEKLDEHIRFGDCRARHFSNVASLATALPLGTAWDNLKQPAQAMVFTMDKSLFPQWVAQLDHIFEVGI